VLIDRKQNSKSLTLHIIEAVLVILGTGVATVVTATIMPMIYIIRLDPKKILM